MPPKKNAKKVNEPEKQNKGPSDPAKSNKPSNSSAQKSGNSAGMFLFVIIVSAALGFGLKTYVDQEVTQIDANVEAIFKKIEPLLNSGLQSTIKDVPEIKEMLRSLKEEQSRVLGSIKTLTDFSAETRNERAKNKKRLDSFGKECERNKEEIEETKSKLRGLSLDSLDAAVAAIDDLKSSIASLENRNEVLQRPIDELIESSKANAKDVKRVDESIGVLQSEVNLIRDSVSGVENDFKAFSEEFQQVASSAVQNNKKVASLDQQLSSLSGSVTKLDGQLQHSIESMGNKLAQSKEERQKFEEAISDKIVMWEGTTSSQLADMLAQVVSAKQLSEKAHSSSKEAEESLKHEFTSAVSRLVEEYQNYEAKVITANQQLKDLQGQVQGLMDEQDEADAEDLKTDLENFRKEINDVTGALRHLQDGVKQSTDRIDSQVTSIGLEVRKASEDAKKMRDDVNSLSASLNKIKQGQVGSKKP